MVLGMLLMFILIAGGEGVVAWFVWRRMAAYLKDNPEGVAALTTHLFVPLLGRQAGSETVAARRRRGVLRCIPPARLLTIRRYPPDRLGIEFSLDCNAGKRSSARLLQVRLMANGSEIRGRKRRVSYTTETAT